MRPEPVLTLDLAKALVALAVGYGWISFPGPDGPTQQQLLVGGLGTVLFMVLSLVTRAKVTPHAVPQTPDGTPLVPAPAVTAPAAAVPDPVPAEPTAPSVGDMVEARQMGRDFGYGKPIV